MNMIMGNRVIGKNMAVIDGKPTGLAGCSNSSTCKLEQSCLRSELALTYRAEHDCGTMGSFFIAKATA